MKTMQNQITRIAGRAARPEYILTAVFFAAMLALAELLNILALAAGPIEENTGINSSRASSPRPTDEAPAQGNITYAAGLLRSRDGQLYGAGILPMKAATSQKQNRNGAIFRLDESGEMTALHSFTNQDGAYPQGNLIEAHDGYLYGVTREGGKHDNGVVFRMRGRQRLCRIA